MKNSFLAFQAVQFISAVPRSKRELGRGTRQHSVSVPLHSKLRVKKFKFKTNNSGDVLSDNDRRILNQICLQETRHRLVRFLVFPASTHLSVEVAPQLPARTHAPLLSYMSQVGPAHLTQISVPNLFFVFLLGGWVVIAITASHDRRCLKGQLLLAGADLPHGGTVTCSRV